MKYVKMLGLAAIAAAALMAFAGPASATILTNGAGAQLGVGTVIHGNAEGTVTLHPPIGDIECGTSTVGGTIGNAGSASTTVSGNLSTLTFGNCNATVTVLKKGSLEVHTKTASADGNGTLTSNGAEVTVVFAGFHCIFTTSNTDIGTVTGSKTKAATLDIEATIPRTGGSSGVFCGSTAQWTGSYAVSSPATLYID